MDGRQPTLPFVGRADLSALRVAEQRDVDGSRPMALGVLPRAANVDERTTDLSQLLDADGVAVSHA